jgi:hypothetical protein
MVNFLSYNEFQNESRIENTHNRMLFESRVNLLNMIATIGTQEEKFVIDTILEANLVNEFYSDSNSVINEKSFKETLINKLDIIKDTIKTSGKKVLTDTQKNILKIGTSVKSYIKSIIGLINKGISSLMNSVKSRTKKAANSSKKLKKAIQENGDVVELKEEAINFKDLYSAGMGWAKSGFVKSIEASMGKKSVLEQFEIQTNNVIIEALESGEITLNQLYEADEDGQPKIPFLAKLVDGIRHIPPVKQLYDFSIWAEKKATDSLNKMSIFFNKVAGASGPHEFPWMGMLVGIGLEELARFPAKIALLLLIPVLGLAVIAIETLEMGLTILSLIAN